MKDNIKRLLDEVREIEASPENQSRKKMYQNANKAARDQWRGVPTKDGSIKYGNVPIQIDMPAPYWHKYLGIDWVKHFDSGEQYLEDMLKIKIERYKQIPDDIFMDKDINIFMGAPFGASLFGHEIILREFSDPEVRYKNLYETPEELAQQGMVDFFNDGLMPNAIKLYNEINELVDDDFNVQFPQWIRAPFGICAYARGYQNFLVDILTDPDFAKAQMQHFTDCRIQWHKDMLKYTGQDNVPIDLFNDDIFVPTLSPEMYEEFVLPYETELANFAGEIGYWHSCGNTSILVEHIKKIPNLVMYNNGPWTDPRIASKSLQGTDIVVELQANPQEVIIQSDEKAMYAYLSNALQSWLDYDIKGATFRVNNVVPQREEGFVMDQIKLYIRTARRVIEDLCK